MKIKEKQRTLRDHLKLQCKIFDRFIAHINNGRIIQINNTNTYRYIKKICIDEIKSISKYSQIHLLKDLYFCENYTFLDSAYNPSLNDINIIQKFGYKSSFYLSFIAHKDSLNNEYIEARKVLYKTMITLREEREQKYRKEQIRISQLSYDEYLQEQRKKKEVQERLESKNINNANNRLILESQDNSIKIIFPDKLHPNPSNKNPASNISMSNLIHIHDNKNVSAISSVSRGTSHHPLSLLWGMLKDRERENQQHR